MVEEQIKPICELKFQNIDENMNYFKEIIETLGKQNEEITKLRIEMVKASERQENSAATIQCIKAELSEVKHEIREQKEKPLSNINTIKITTITTVISTLIGLTIGKIF